MSELVDLSLFATSPTHEGDGSWLFSSEDSRRSSRQTTRGLDEEHVSSRASHHRSSSDLIFLPATTYRRSADYTANKSSQTTQPSQVRTRGHRHHLSNLSTCRNQSSDANDIRTVPDTAGNTKHRKPARKRTLNERRQAPPTQPLQVPDGSTHTRSQSNGRPCTREAGAAKPPNHHRHLSSFSSTSSASQRRASPMVWLPKEQMWLVTISDPVDANMSYTKSSQQGVPLTPGVERASHHAAIRPSALATPGPDLAYSPPPGSADVVQISPIRSQFLSLFGGPAPPPPPSPDSKATASKTHRSKQGGQTLHAASSATSSAQLLPDAGTRLHATHNLFPEDRDCRSARTSPTAYSPSAPRMERCYSDTTDHRVSVLTSSSWVSGEISGTSTLMTGSGPDLSPPRQAVSAAVPAAVPRPPPSPGIYANFLNGKLRGRDGGHGGLRTMPGMSEPKPFHSSGMPSPPLSPPSKPSTLLQPHHVSSVRKF